MIFTWRKTLIGLVDEYGALWFEAHDSNGDPRLQAARRSRIARSRRCAESAP